MVHAPEERTTGQQHLETCFFWVEGGKKAFIMESAARESLSLSLRINDLSDSDFNYISFWFNCLGKAGE